MKRITLLLVLVLLLGGCNLITPQTIAIHAGKAVAKKVIKEIAKPASDEEEVETNP